MIICNFIARERSKYLEGLNSVNTLTKVRQIALMKVTFADIKKKYLCRNPPGCLSYTLLQEQQPYLSFERLWSVR